MKANTLVQLIEQFRGQEEIAIIDYGEYRKFAYTYDQLYLRSKKFVTFLENNSIEKGDKLMVWSYNGMDWATILCGCILAGVIFVPVDLHSQEDFVRKIKISSGAKIIMQTKFKPALKDLKTFFVEDLEEQLRPLLPSEYKIRLQEDYLVELVYTSGTTGEPKGVMINHRNIISNLKGVDKLISINSSYKFLSLLPLSHMFEQVGGFFVPMAKRASIVYLKTLKASSILNAFREEKITNALVVPAILNLFKNSIMAKVKEKDKEKQFEFLLKFAKRFPLFRRLLFKKVHESFGGRLNYFIVGGAAFDPELEEFFENLGFPIIQGYGLTETGPVLTVNQVSKRKSGSAGRALPNVKLKISSEGEILASGPNITVGYYRNAQKTKELFEKEWLKTGDIGYLDREGYLFIKGRKKEMIKTAAGLPVYPDDIESILNKISGVRESTIIGMPTERGERVHAVLLLERGADLKTIISRTNQRLAEHQQITSYSVWPFEDFPKTSTLKIKKFVVKNYLLNKTKEPVGIIEKHDKFYSVLARLTLHKIQSGSTLEALGLSSMDRVELVSLLEQEFSIEIDEAKILATTKVKDLEEMVKKKAKFSEKVLFRDYPLKLSVIIIRAFFQKILFFPLIRIFTRPSVSGLENLKDLSGPVIFVPNHQSHFDSPLILMHLPLRFSAKTAIAAWREYFLAEDLEFKNFGMWLLFHFITFFFNIYPFPQNKEYKRAMQYTGKLIVGGWNIMIFPEGERSMSDKLLPFKHGVGLLAVEMKVPIVPIRLEGVAGVYPMGRRWPSFGKVKITFGKPIHLDNMSYFEATEKMKEVIERLKSGEPKSL